MSTKRISELPLMEEVTENLNILVEDDGETKRIPASSVGGGMMRVNITMNDEGDAYIADKTYAEIAEAIIAGIIPYCVFGTFVLSLYHSSVLSEVATFREETKMHKFSALDTYGTRMGYVSIDIHGTVNYEEFIFNPNT